MGRGERKDKCGLMDIYKGGGKDHLVKALLPLKGGR